MRKATIFKALKRKPILALVVGAVVFSSAFAFAATLGVTSASLGAGNAAVTSCAASVTTGYTTSYDNTVAGKYKVATVTVTGTLTSCGTKQITVDLSDSTGASLGQVSRAITAGEATAGTLSLTVPGSVSAQAVQNVSAVISG
jgi:hypothetical protein